jgi:hypothetical protein
VNTSHNIPDNVSKATSQQPTAPRPHKVKVVPIPAAKPDLSKAPREVQEGAERLEFILRHFSSSSLWF